MVVAEQKKEEKDTQITQNKKKQRMKTEKQRMKTDKKTDKKNCGNFFTSFWFLTQFNSYISIYTL